jgi:hypothetical protein
MTKIFRKTWISHTERQEIFELFTYKKARYNIIAKQYGISSAYVEVLYKEYLAAPVGIGFGWKNEPYYLTEDELEKDFICTFDDLSEVEKEIYLTLEKEKENEKDLIYSEFVLTVGNFNEFKTPEQIRRYQEQINPTRNKTL